MAGTKIRAFELQLFYQTVPLEADLLLDVANASRRDIPLDFKMYVSERCRQSTAGTKVY